MRLSIGAAATASLALAGCVGEERADFVASAPEAPARSVKLAGHNGLDERIAHYARTNGVPETLVHRIVQRESKYNPSLRHGPYWGLMQIRHDTARSMGYAGSAAGLLDSEVNMTYAVAYLANAYRVAQGDERRAVRLYAGGYYYEAKRLGLLGEMRRAPSAETKTATAAAAPN
jgi:soluble lytic murein transglycosylase-like protein